MVMQNIQMTSQQAFIHLSGMSLSPERTDRSGNRSGDSKGPERFFFLQTKKNKNKKIKNLNSD